MSKLPHQSKKFIGFFFVISILAALGIIALFTQTVGWQLAAFMLAIILTIGTVGVGYILGQAGLDKYEGAELVEEGDLVAVVHPEP